ncbi:hypothetical protein DVH24_001004 [Malus domestica]|uniref:RBR-type E3 ubiquitin transferase n=1 Tax=Malus domestica TaxID=3750 RepID=A0A498JXZ1_MALDO|nr:hypothetical protein DVH24_001004 [Malus domestica]
MGASNKFAGAEILILSLRLEFLKGFSTQPRTTKWCPYPGCEYAVNFVGDIENYDVSCLCSYGFCWNCTEEAHRPVDCSTVEKWILKNSAESENMNWARCWVTSPVTSRSIFINYVELSGAKILANSKPCPKCKRPIEKNQGCMHMTCTPPCKFQLCWLCLGSWSEHGERTGGFYACNRYEAAEQEEAVRIYTFPSPLVSMV